MAEKNDNEQGYQPSIAAGILTAIGSGVMAYYNGSRREAQTQTYEVPAGYRPSPSDSYPSFTSSQIVTIQVGVGMVVVVSVAALLIVREVKKQKQKRTTPKATQSTGAKPYAKGRRDNPHKRKYYPVNGDNRVTPSPQPQEHPEIPERIIEWVMQMNLDRATAIRLLEWTASRHPKEGWGWVAEKVIFDLERDRSRA